MSKLQNYIYPIATLSGTIIGVGFFSLPYITAKTGILIMLGYFLFLGALVIISHLFFSELALKTPDYKRLPGFAKIYLGNAGEKIAYLSTVLGILGAILAYLIVGGEFLSNLLSPLFGGNVLLYTLLYFSAGAILIFFGIKAIAKVEFWGLIGFFLILILMFFRSKTFINVENLFSGDWILNIRDWKFLFLPYGVILFSLWGIPLVPEIEEMLGEKKQLIKKIIPIAILIPILVYFLFIYLVLGITGSETTESSIVGLGKFLSPGLMNLGFFFGILTTFTSFISLGLTLRKVFWYDLKIDKNLAWLITCFVPLAIFLIGIKNFILVISFVGAVMFGIDGILILLMYYKLRSRTAKIKSLLIPPLVLVFLGGIVYEIIYFIK